MTPLGSSTPGRDPRRASTNLDAFVAGLDRENSGMHTSYCSAETPIDVGREVSGLGREMYDGDLVSARSTMSMRTPAMFGLASQMDGTTYTGSPKLSEGLLLTASRSPRRVLRPLVATQTHEVPQSPSVAIFSAAEGLLPSPCALLRNQSGLSTLGMHDELVMGRQLSGLL